MCVGVLFCFDHQNLMLGVMCVGVVVVVMCVMRGGMHRIGWWHVGSGRGVDGGFGVCGRVVVS